MKYWVALIFIPCLASAEVTLDLSLGLPLADEHNYYGDAPVAMADLCYVKTMTKLVDLTGCAKHISKTGHDFCGESCYGDNWATIGIRLKLVD